MLAVLGALFANGLIAVLKFVAALVTGSSGMMADTDQIIGTIEEVEQLIKRAEPKVEKIFLEAVRDRADASRVQLSEKVG